MEKLKKGKAVEAEMKYRSGGESIEEWIWGVSVIELERRRVARAVKRCKITVP